MNSNDLEKDTKDYSNNQSNINNMDNVNNHNFDLESMSSSGSTVVEEEIIAKEDIQPLLNKYQRYFMLMLAVLGGFYSSLRRAYYVSYDETYGKILE